MPPSLISACANGRLYGQLIAPPTLPAAHAPEPAFAVYRGRICTRRCGLPSGRNSSRSSPRPQAWWSRFRRLRKRACPGRAGSPSASIPTITSPSGPAAASPTPSKASPIGAAWTWRWCGGPSAPATAGRRSPPAPWQREIVLDNAAALAFHGFTRADRLTQAADAPRPCDLARPASRVSTAVRLAEVYSASRAAPDLFETALELPARLFLSPAQTATWKTPSPGIRRALAALPPLSGARTRPAASPCPAAPRTLDSPPVRGGHEGRCQGDLVAGFPSRGPAAAAGPKWDRSRHGRFGAPPRGPWKPWAIRRSLGGRSPAGDLAELDGQRFHNGWMPTTGTNSLC